MDKSVFLCWWFSFDLQYYLILGGTNNVLHTSVKKNLCTLGSLALAKKFCNNINNSCAQVSGLCYSLWLCFIRLMTLKPNKIIECKPWNRLVSHHSQGNMSKITLILQLYMIICFFVRQLFVLKIFQFLLKVHVISNLRFRKVFWSNY